MPFTAGVGSADEVLPSMFVDFQIIGDVLALRTIAKNHLIRWMVHAKVFHGVLQ
jgi:predicted signal transduction protein with EAL and GGDEF domain